jgi:hypothetical protein
MRECPPWAKEWIEADQKSRAEEIQRKMVKHAPALQGMEAALLACHKDNWHSASYFCFDLRRAGRDPPIPSYILPPSPDAAAAWETVLSDVDGEHLFAEHMRKRHAMTISRIRCAGELRFLWIREPCTAPVHVCMAATDATA